jgi:hypothetical protein
MPFVKLDTGILESSLWMDRAAREVFITALCMAEPRELEHPTAQIEADNLNETGFVVPPGWYGFVPAAGIGILRRALVGIDEGMTALKTLGAVDPHTRSPEFEGRRLVRVNGGFIILNFFRYRDRDYSAAERMRKLRARKKAQKKAHGVTPNSYGVTPNSYAAEVRGQSSEVKGKKERAKPPAASAAARGLCERLSLTGRKNEGRIHEAIALEAKNSSQTEEEVADRFYAAWEYYRTKVHDPHFKVKLAVTFFEDGVWKDIDKMSGWVYKPTKVQSEQKPANGECRCYKDGNGRQRICPDCEDKNKAAKGRKKAK